MVNGELNFKNIIDGRYLGTRRIIKIKFYSILTGVVFLLIVTVFLYLIAYTDISNLFGFNLNNDFIYHLRYYIYWIIFFNNILIPISLLYLYYLFIDSIDILTFSGEKKNPFSDDETFNF